MDRRRWAGRHRTWWYDRLERLRATLRAAQRLRFQRTLRTWTLCSCMPLLRQRARQAGGVLEDLLRIERIDAMIVVRVRVAFCRRDERRNVLKHERRVARIERETAVRVARREQAEVMEPRVPCNGAPGWLAVHTELNQRAVLPTV